MLRPLQKRIAIGDQQAFTDLYQYFAKRLIHFSEALVKTREGAEELVEDVFVRLWRNRKDIESIENITVYLYVSVKNASLNEISRQAVQSINSGFQGLDIEVDDFSTNPYELMVTAEMMQQMKEAIDALPPRCKMIFKLIREDGLPYKQVAEILNISINTIDAQMAIAVKRICSAMGVSRESVLSKHFSRKS